MQKKFLALFTALVMVLTMLPASLAYADAVGSGALQPDLAEGSITITDCGSYKQVEQNGTVTKTTGNVIIKQTDSASTKTENVIKLIGNTSDFKVSILDLNVDAVDRPAIEIEGKVTLNLLGINNLSSRAYVYVSGFPAVQVDAIY